MAGPKWKQHSDVSVSGGESKAWCCKEQYCIGTWNVRSMNQGKLELVKQEMARVNIDIVGKNLIRNGVALIVNKSPKGSTWVQQDDLSSLPRQTIQYHSNPSLCPKQ